MQSDYFYKYLISNTLHSVYSISTLNKKGNNMLFGNNKKNFAQDALYRQNRAFANQMMMENKHVAANAHKIQTAPAQKSLKLLDGTIVAYDLFMSFIIQNDSTETLPFVLLDPRGLYQIQVNYNQDPNINISAKPKGYEATQRRLLANEQWTLVALRLEVTSGKETQFDQTINVYQDRENADGVSLLETIYPAEGLNSYQQQANRVELQKTLNIDSRTALAGDIIGECTYTLRSYFSKKVIKD